MKSKNGNQKYTKEFKLKAVRLHFDKGYSSSIIAEELGIGSSSTVRRWLREYRKDGEKAFDKKPRKKRKNKPMSKDERIKELEMQVAVLKKIREYVGGDAPKE